MRALIESLHEYVAELDEVGAGDVLDAALTAWGFERALEEVLIPYLREPGDRWADGRATVVHEHFASSLIRRRLAGLTTAWHRRRSARRARVSLGGAARPHAHRLRRAARPRRLAGAASGRRHPLTDIALTCTRARPDLIVLSATRADVFEAGRAPLVQLRDVVGADRLGLAGAGATAGLAGWLGVHHLPGSPVAAARALTADQRSHCRT